jgi:hypothetical protein
MRTQEEILQRIAARKSEDVFGFEIPYYVNALSFENAKPFLVEGTKPEEWTQQDAEAVRKEAIDYMAFAWEKANNCRGISANRSISHYQAWLWLLGVEWCDRLWDDYEFYGKPQLIRICEYFGLDPKKWDDGIRTN